MDIKQVDLKSALQSQYLIRKKILEGCQRIARRDKKGFLSDQCKEIEENTRDLFKKIRDNKATFNAKMGTIKDRNGMDLTGTEILIRSGKNTECVCRSVVSNTL